MSNEIPTGLLVDREELVDLADFYTVGPVFAQRWVEFTDGSKNRRRRLRSLWMFCTPAWTQWHVWTRGSDAAVAMGDSLVRRCVGQQHHEVGDRVWMLWQDGLVRMDHAVHAGTVEKVELHPIEENDQGKPLLTFNPSNGRIAVAGYGVRHDDGQYLVWMPSEVIPLEVVPWWERLKNWTWGLRWRTKLAWWRWKTRRARRISSSLPPQPSPKPPSS